METKLFLLAMMVTLCADAAVSHIVTSSHVDLPIGACMRSLASATRNILCSAREFYPPEYSYEDYLKRAFKRQEQIEACCRRPCTVLELMLIC